MLSREAILGAALGLLEEQGLEALSMRAVARRLEVDAMAPYHYFPDRESLLKAAAERVYTQLGLSLRVPRGRDFRGKLEYLAAAYLALLAPARQLLLVLSAHPELALGPARIFEAHFKAAVTQLKLSRPLYRAALAAYVDLIHGFALGLSADASKLRRARLGPAGFKAELQIFLAGLAAMAGAQSARPAQKPAAARADRSTRTQTRTLSRPTTHSA